MMQLLYIPRLFTHMSTAIYSRVNWGDVEISNNIAQAIKQNKGDSNPGSLDCELGVLPPSYSALHTIRVEYKSLL